MTLDPLGVSIIVPVYNVEDYIVRCANSVLCQNYSPLEVLFVDDCGNDNSIAILEKVLNDYDGCVAAKVIKHDNNRGLSAARNTGLQYASGEYVFFLDSDDEIPPDAIRKLVERISGDHSEEMVIGNVKAIPTSGYFELPCYSTPTTIDSNYSIRLNYLKPWPSLPVFGWNKLIKKEFLFQHGLFFREGIIHEDELWTSRCVLVLQKIIVVDDVTYYHYETPNSIMSTIKKEKRANNMAIILSEVCKNVSGELKCLQIYRYLDLFINIFPDLHSIKRKWELFFAFVLLLISEKEYKSAMMLLIYCLSFPILRGKHYKRFSRKQLYDRWCFWAKVDAPSFLLVD